MGRPDRKGGKRLLDTLAPVLHSVPVRVALLVAAATVAYGASLRASVAWDDAAVLSANPAIRSLEHPLRFFTDPWTINPSGGAMLSQYRPLRTLLFACEFAVFGGDAWGYHLVSLLLHGLGAWAVGALAARLFGRGGWLAAGVWLLHPVLSENALYLAAQSNSLCLLGAALALLWHLDWLRGGRARTLGAAVAAALASMLSYEFGALIPILVVLTELVWRSRGGKVRGNVVARNLPYWAALAAFVALRAAIVQPIPQGDWWNGSWGASVLMQLRLWLEGWRLSLLPIVPLPRYMPYDIPAFAALPVALLFHAGLIGLTVVLVRKRQLVIPSVIAWWYVAQLPTSNILVPNLGYPFATRFLVLALILPVAAASAWLADQTGRHTAVVAALLGVGIVAIASDRRQTAIWQDETALFTEIKRRSPNDFTAAYNLGTGYVRFGMLARAGDELAETAALDPGFAATFFALGDVARAQGNLAAARTFYGMTLQRYPNHIPARLALAELDIAAGQTARAESWVAPIGSLAKWPPYRRARFELGLADVASRLQRCVESRGRVEEALRHWQHTSDVLFQAGKVLTRCGERSRGLELLCRASGRAGDEYREMVGYTAWLTD